MDGGCGSSGANLFPHPVLTESGRRRCSFTMFGKPYNQQRRSRRTTLAVVLSALRYWTPSHAWIVNTASRIIEHHHTTLASASLQAKRKRKDVDISSWYDAVDEDASPDEVFWQEMERQRLLSQTIGSEDGVKGTSVATATRPSPSVAAKSVEATLGEYAAYAVEDNWLDEELQWMMRSDDAELTEDRTLDEQLEDWAAEDDDSENMAWMMQSDDPWDRWGQKSMDDEERIAIDLNNKAADFLLEDDDDELDEAVLLQRISNLKIRSQRLERARNNPKAQAYFAREPDAMEGFDRLWVSAIDNVCFKNLRGTFRNYGIEFADNFGDWKDGCLEDGFFSIEDVASFKARQVYNVTGLPCIASRTSFEVEPIPQFNTGSGPRPNPTTMNPRVTSGYRFNDVGVHVDHICEALRPLSQPSRVTEFKTCLCYYDGEMELYQYGILECDLVFADSLRTFIPVSQAITEMIKTLEQSLDLEYQPWIKKRVDEVSASYGAASIKLRDRVLKEGKVLPNDIIDVSAFMDSKVDVELMDDCAKELANHFISQKPSKILTVATTGLVIALPMAKYLGVPVVYARKERNVVMADTYKATYTSKTVGQNRELLISTSHIDEDDRILIVDDFLSSGSSQEALLRIILEAGATAVGVGVLLEKVYDSGRQSLSGFDIPVHSLCRVASVENGAIQLLEEEGYDRMQKSK